MPGAAWLDLLCRHIPDCYEHLVRYVGWYSNRAHGERAKGQDTLTMPAAPSAPVSAFAAPAKAAWARLVRAIAISGAKRAPSLPETPTFEELGLRGYQIATWTGMWVPASTPKEVVTRLHREVVKATALPDMRERFAELGVEGIGDTPEEFDAFVRAEIANWGKVVRETGMRVE